MFYCVVHIVSASSGLDIGLKIHVIVELNLSGKQISFLKKICTAPPGRNTFFPASEAVLSEQRSSLAPWPLIPPEAANPEPLISPLAAR